MVGARGVMIRDAIVMDATDIAAIYAHHVLHGTASFETEPPTVDFWTRKISEIDARDWPFVVADRDSEILGYAYATQFRDRAAYAHTCENSVYVRADAVGQGIGVALMTALVERAKAAGFREIIAVVGGGEPASVALHTKCGFRHAGRMEKVGRKFGRLLDTVYMQYSIKAED
jgi:L-amino acid N-acyltransferase YncA